MKCVIYEGPEPQNPSRFGWPLVALFEPFPGTAEKAIENWIEMRRETGRDPVRGRSQFEEFPSKTGRLVGVAYAQDDKTVANTGVLLMAFERESVSIPLAIWGHRREHWNLRMPAVRAIVDTLQLDTIAIRNQQNSLHDAVVQAQRDLDAAVANGVHSLLFFGEDLVLRGGPGAGSAAPMHTPQDVVVAFLPGGVFAPFFPRALDRIDVASLAPREAPPRWRREGENYVVTFADGRQERFLTQSDESLLWRKQNRDRGLRDVVTLLPVRHVTRQDLVGQYRYSASFAGYAFGPGPPLVAMGGRERSLVLAPDGIYTLIGMTTSAAAGTPLINRSRERESGNWQYDPNSWTLTLTPNGLSPVSSSAFRPPIVRKSAEADKWILFGSTWTKEPR